MSSTEMPWVRVKVPSADASAIRLNRGMALGAGRLSGSYRPGNTLGGGALGGFVLGGGYLPVSKWIDLGGEATTITTWRGMAGKSRGLLTGDVGTLTVRVVSTAPLDDVRPGTPIAVGIGAQTWWTGTVLRCKQTDADPDARRVFVTITATDAVSPLASVTIAELPSLRIQSAGGGDIGSLCDEPDPRTDPTWGPIRSRFARIMSFLPLIEWEKTAARGPLHWSYTGDVTQYGGIGEPMTAAELLDISCASIRAMWWITSAGQVRIAEDAADGDPVGHLSDEPGSHSYTAIDAAVGPDTLVTRVKLTTRQLEPGATAATGETVEYFWEWADPTLVATWGENRLELAVNVEAMGGYEHALGAWYSAPWFTQPSASDRLTVEKVVVNGAPDWDIADVIQITHRGRTATCRIRGIERTVTPDPRRGSPKITTTLHLTERAA